MPLLLSRTLRRLVGALVLLVLAVVGGTAASIWWTARSDDRAPSDIIVVLGASQFDGRPSSVLEARLEHARALHSEGVAPLVVTVGGRQEGDRFTEAGAGADYLTERGVPSLAVGEGSNTQSSLEALAGVMDERGWGSAVLVTDPWHAMRSRRMASDLGIDAVSSPTRQGPSVRTRGTQVRYLVRETGAYLSYRLLGRSVGGGLGGDLLRAVGPR